MIKVGRSTYIDRSTPARVVKHEVPAPDVLYRKIIRKLTKGSLPFQNEILINTYFQKISFHHLKFPKLSSSTDDRLTFELIADALELHSELRSLNSEELSSICSQLNELNSISTIPARQRRPLLRKLLFFAISNPAMVTIRRICTAPIELPQRLRLLACLLGTIWTTNTGRKSLIHNDLAIGNILKDKEGTIYFIDFEDATFTSRFILADIIDATTQGTTFDISTAALHYQRLCGGDINSRSARNSLKLAIIRNVMHRLCSPKVSKETKLFLKDFLEHTVLKTNEFQQWISQQLLTRP